MQDDGKFKSKIYIEGSEAKFEINELGVYTQESYKGKFRVKCILSPLEEIEADKSYRELLGYEFNLAETHIKQKAFALAQLKVRVMESPPFWKGNVIDGGHIADSNIILGILDLAIDAQEMYIAEKIKEKAQLEEELTVGIESGMIEKEPEEESEEEDDLQQVDPADIPLE